MHTFITIIARDFIVLPLVISGWVWWKLDNRRKRQVLIVGAAAALLAILAAKAGTKLVYSPRPFIADHVVPYFSSARDNGFPSDHTLLATVVATVLLFFSRGWGLICLALAVVIGGARVVAGVHHGIDIVGGLLIGIAAGFSAYYGLLTLRRLRPIKPSEPDA